MTVMTRAFGFASLSMLAASVAFAQETPRPAEPAPAAPALPSAYVKPNIKHDKYGLLKVVVPVTTDDKGMQGMKLRNLKNSFVAAEQWGGKMEAVVVLYAKGVSLLRNPSKEIETQIDDLKKKGVRFEVCDNSLREQGIDYHTLYHVTESDIVPSGFAEVAYLQAHKQFVVDPAS